MKDFDDNLDELLAMIGLINENCHLNHGSDITPPPAVDYLCQYVGKIEKGVGTADSLLRIPICEECAGTLLYDDDWLLFYCLTCNSSQWLIKSKAKKLYPKWESIKFLSMCPKCAPESI